MPDIFDAVNDLSKRLSSIEQEATGTIAHQAAQGANGILPPTTTVGGVPIAGDIGAPQNLSASPGTFLDKIYVDLSYDEPLVGHAASYEIELSRKLGPALYDFVTSVVTSSENPRIDNLEPATEYGVRVYAINAIGVRSTPTDMLDFTSLTDSVAPGQVATVNAYAGLKTMTVVWDEVADSDVARGAGQYELQVDTDPDFPAADSYYTSGLIMALTNVVVGTQYFVRVRAIDASGNEGAWSDWDDATPGAAGSVDIGEGVIYSDHIITAGLDAAVVKFGQMLGDRIQANTLDASKIKTSELIAADITLNGGSLRAGSPPVNGVIFNSQGVRSYKDSQLVVVIDANGDAQFNNVTVTGVFQTATSGARIRIEKSGSYNFLKFYSAVSGETSPGELSMGTTDGINQAFVTIRTPVVGLNDRGTEIMLYADGSFATPVHHGLMINSDLFQLSAINYIGDFETPNPYLKTFSAQRFRIYTDAIYITKSFGINFSTTLPPLQVGSPAVTDIESNTTYYDNLALGGSHILARYGLGETLLKLNHYSTGSHSGVLLGGAGYAGRYGGGVDLSANFCQKDWRGQAFGYGVRHFVNGNLYLCGSNIVILKTGGWHEIGIDTSGVFVTGDQVRFPDLPYTSSGGGNLIGAYDGGGVTGRFYRVTSSIRGKGNVLDLADDPATPDPTLLHLLRPRSYTSLYENDHVRNGVGRRYVGLIAEEVADVHPDLGVLDQNGDVINVDWPPIWTMLIAEVQKLRAEVDELKGKHERGPGSRTAGR